VLSPSAKEEADAIARTNNPDPTRRFIKSSCQIYVGLSG
jgi:hypothetical protein